MTPSRQAKTRKASPGVAEAHLSKAREYLRAATDSLALDNRVAATGNAVHAGIAAADAIAAALVGSVWAGEHSQAPAHLEKAGADGRQAATQLRRLLPLKTKAEYDPAPISAGDARAALKAAERMVAIAERIVAATPRKSKQ
ncbi:MAG TPA: hypothetical protein VNC61_06000 [Acidimicrobiales bacterium]|nr:hypothetical protein [Acidimicrobiales bacterium]